MKRIILSLTLILGLGAIVATGTGAFFTESEASQGNMFVAGNIDLTVQHLYAAHNGEECLLDCEGDCDPNIPVGACTLWDAQDWPESFFYFEGIKPGDWGQNTISLHIEDNDAYSCLFVHDVENAENDLVDSELALSDNALFGELGDLIEVVFWHDANQNNLFEGSEEELLRTTLAGAVEVPIHDSALSNGVHAGDTTEYIAMAWCAGALGVGAGGEIECDGTVVSGLADTNLAQSDSLLAEVTAYAVQARNNGDFECVYDDIAGGGSGGGGGPAPSGI